MERNRTEVKKLSVSDFTIVYRGGTKDKEVINHSFGQNIFFNSIPGFDAGEAELVVDVGAHIGCFSLKTITLNPSIKIIAIEASDKNYRLLVENVKNNGLENSIFPLKAALSDRIGNEILYMSDENWGHTITSRRSENTEIVPSITLEELFRIRQIENCDLIKFNCEGAEFKILLSTPADTIKKVKMMILLLHEDLELNFNRHHVYNYLKKSGFFFRTLNEGTNRCWIIAKNKLHYGQTQDLLFRVKNKLTNLF